MEQSVWLSTREHDRGSEDRYLRKERRAPLPLLSGADEGLPSLHGEMCATARPLLLGEKRATARPLLLQWSGMCEGTTCGKAVPSRLSHPRSVSCRLKFEVLCKKLKVRSFRTSVGRLTGAGGARRGRDDGRHDCERGMNGGRVGRCAACGGCGWYGRCAGRRGGCGAVLSAPSKKTRLPTAALFAICI